jgi:hypothetical protein
MTDESSEAPQGAVKGEQSRFLLLESLSNHPVSSGLNWDDFIPSESELEFDSSFNIRVASFSMGGSVIQKVALPFLGTLPGFATALYLPHLSIKNKFEWNFITPKTLSIG